MVSYDTSFKRSFTDLEESRQENRKLLSTIDRLKETELSLRSQVDKVSCWVSLPTFKFLTSIIQKLSYYYIHIVTS